MEINDLLSREHARGDSFKHLAVCYQQPTRGLLDDIRKLEYHLASVCPEAALHAQNMMGDFESVDTLESLTVDYARLFVGPYGLLAPPYGSVYLDNERQIMGESTLDARNRYREAGLDIAGEFLDPPDHITAQLEFLYFLICKEIEALANSDIDATVSLLEKQRDFLREHLGAWVFDFADSIEEKAESDFYKNLARATRVFARQELDHLDGLDLVQLS